MEINELKNSVYKRLDTIAAAEKITKKEMVPMADELLVYVPTTKDIDVVNRLLGVLTPANRKFARIFFQHFLPWEVEKDAKGNFVRFGKKTKKEKVLARKEGLIAEFLADDEKTFWTWVDENVEVSKKNYGARISNTVKAALKGDEKSGTEPLTAHEVLVAVMDGGVKMVDLLKEVSEVITTMKEIENNDNVVELKDAA